jgi:hypothetical protein
LKKPAAIISEISPVNVGLDLLAEFGREDLEGLAGGACPTLSNRAIRATISSSVPSIVTVPPLAVATVAFGIERLHFMASNGASPTVVDWPSFDQQKRTISHET